MPQKRVETKTSRTAEWTCLSRAASSLESNRYYKCDDDLAVQLLPGLFKSMMRVPVIRRFFCKRMAPEGIYEYVIARTKYIDAAFRQALAERFEQILIFGAGFDTRGLRFQAEARDTKIFELDVPITQQAKIGQYRKRNLKIPSNVVFISIDFDKESLPAKLDEAGFSKNRSSLFVLEGLIMYLQPDSVQATFQTIRDYAGNGSRVVFDYVHASVLRQENKLFGEAAILKTVTGASEYWHFGLDPEGVEPFLATYGFEVRDHKDAQALEAAYFQDLDGRIVGRINATHSLVIAEKTYERAGIYQT